MAIYHLSMSNVSRGAGSSAVASASYITGKRLHDDMTNEDYNYGRRQRVIAHGTILPPGADPEWEDPGVLWNAVEHADKNKNARPAKKVVVALPREWDHATQREVLEQFICQQLTDHGYAATWAIHDDGDGNPHAHILIANRPLQKNGKWGAKSVNSYKLDENGERVPVIDPKTGEQKIGARNRRMWQSVKLPHRLDRLEALTEMREAWAEACNDRLAPDQAIDHRSFADQGREDLPTIHEGYAARRMEAAGHVSDRCEINREILEAREIQEVTETDLVRMGEDAVTTPGGLRDACEAAAMYPSVSAATLAAIVGYANLPINCITEWRPPKYRLLVLTVPVHELMSERPDDPLERGIIAAIANTAAGRRMNSVPARYLAEAASTIGGRGIMAMVRAAVRWLISKMREIAERIQQRTIQKKTAATTEKHPIQTVTPASHTDDVPVPFLPSTVVPDIDDVHHADDVVEIAAETDVLSPQPDATEQLISEPETKETQASIVRMRPTPDIERRHMLREAQKMIEQTDIKTWMEKHSIHAKPKRMKCGGKRRDVLRMPNGRNIEINGSQWAYAEKYGLTGGGGLIQFALAFAEPYKSFDITGGAHWHRAVRELAEEICPEVVRYINQRPMTPEEMAEEDGLVRQEPTSIWGLLRDGGPEPSSPGRDDWER